MAKISKNLPANVATTLLHCWKYRSCCQVIVAASVPFVSDRKNTDNYMSNKDSDPALTLAH